MKIRVENISNIRVAHGKFLGLRYDDLYGKSIFWFGYLECIVIIIGILKYLTTMWLEKMKDLGPSRIFLNYQKLSYL